MNIYENYAKKATLIRNQHHAFIKGIQDDDSLNENYRETEIKKEKERAKSVMQDLKLEYRQTKEREEKGYFSKAFSPGDKTAYLSALNAADAMDSKTRLKATKNAISIDAHNETTAYAHAAYNSGDRQTLEYILENAHISVSSPIASLLEYEKQASRDKNDVRLFEMTAFALS